MKISSSFENWVSIAANLGVLVGIVFLVLEIRTNTESNILGLQSNYSNNFMQINSATMSREIAEIIHKSETGEPLTPVEEIQLRGYFQMFLTQTNYIRRLFVQGVATEDEFRDAYTYLHSRIGDNELFQEWVSTELSEAARRLYLEEDGFNQYIENVR